MPTRYYLNLRLNRARLLLLQTSKSIADIALTCRFISAPHFRKCYRDLFGIPPRDKRRKLQRKSAPLNCGRVGAATSVGFGHRQG